MSVPVWKCKLSSAEYVYQTYQLNIRLGEILINKPQKYKTNYADEIIQTALSALKHVQIADSIFMSKYTKESDYFIRRENLLLAKGELQHVATACYIYMVDEMEIRLMMNEKSELNSEELDNGNQQ